jgi:radical SAM protein with 4Fe4S-binding SPASM domain
MMHYISFKKNIGYLRKVAGLLLSRKSIAYLILFVTDKCNARCRMCFSHEGMSEKKSQRNILSLKDIERLLTHKRLKHLTQFTISGGEPFLREDIEDIIYLYSGLHSYSRLTLPTNGLLTDRILKVMKRFIPNNPMLEISMPLTILGVGKNHDEITGVKGHFNTLNETIQALQPLRTYPNFKLGGVTVLSSLNQHRMEEITDFFKQNNKYFDDFNMLYTRGETRDPESKNINHLVYSKYRSELPNERIVIDLLVKTLWRQTDMALEQKKMGINCNAGRKLLVIGERGDVFPCELLNTFTHPVMGNLYDFDFDLDALLWSEPAQKIKEFIKNKQCYCSFECAILSSLIFSPSNYSAFFKTIFRRK